MARSAPPQPQRPNHTPDQKRAAIRRLEASVADLEAFDPSSLIQRDGNAQVRDIETGIDAALTFAFGTGTPDDLRYRDAATLDHGPRSYSVMPDWIAARGGGFARGESPEDFRSFFGEGKTQALVLLRRAIKQLSDEIADDEAVPGPAVSVHTARLSAPSKRVFIVHGRDDGPRQAVARLIERLGLEAVILNDKPNQGRTVIEKLEAHSDVGFAVVLLTPDDEGNLVGEAPQPRARQNVLIELGLFIGKLNRSRVCTLIAGDLEIPSDWRGVIDERFDTGDGWKLKLARELRAAGYKIDLNDILDR